jgi:hypothetical protein
MHPVVRATLDDAAETFGPGNVTFTELPDGSVKVTVSGQNIGEGWAPSVISITTTLLATFPSPPPYPFYLPGDLRKTGGTAVPNMTAATIDGIDVIQLSLRPQGGRPEASFPALICGITSWLRGQ